MFQVYPFALPLAADYRWAKGVQKERRGARRHRTRGMM